MEEYPQGSDKGKWPEQVAFLIDEAKAGKVEAAYSLLNWLQDINWPGAREASEYLVANLETILPKIREVLRDDDDVWQYFVLNGLVAAMPREMAREFTSELVELTEHDDGHEVNLAAALVLCEKQLCPRDELIAIVERVERFNPGRLVEVEEIKKYLGYFP